MALENTKTEANLKASFAGESQARNKYTYFASQARKDGFEQIAGIFEETANHEKEHAKSALKYLGGIGDTEVNLKAAIEGESFEWTHMYKQFEDEARQEGFDDIADWFKAVGKVEEEHERRYKALLKTVVERQVFQRDTPKRWMCRNCGYVHEGKEAPLACPACKHPQAFFEVKAESY